MNRTSFASIARNPLKTKKKGTFIDLFCGIGGFHTAAVSFDMEGVFASDIDVECRAAYAHNYDLVPKGDITAVNEEDIPDHDLLCAGFPCQPFSIIGHGKGFNDIRGTLFFDIARILKAKQPPMFMLENVKQLAGHDGGKTLKRILEVLRSELNYFVDHKVLNALNYGVPQKRERVIIVGFKDEAALELFKWPAGGVPMKPLSEILEKDPDKKHFTSEPIRKSRAKKHESEHKIGIWHENKSGNVSSYPYSCALRAGASYNYLLVNGERRLTPREMLRLQGFPESFEIVCSDSQTRKQAGNAVPVPMIAAVMEQVLYAGRTAKTQTKRKQTHEKRAV
jgi:DNA (cytosine-5)-methyltransferase 1